MKPKLTEAEGVRLLREEFEKAGLSIRDGEPFEVAGKVLSLDGYDPERRVGFEFVTEEAGDRGSFGEETVAALEAMLERGEAWLLLVDEWDVEEPEELRFAARRFLEELRSRGALS
jgi:hypothetical protein